MEDEIWALISEAENLYEVSTFGRVRRVGSDNLLGQWKNNKGYLMVSLSVNGRNKQRLVHRLVALGFIENPDNKNEVNHIDFDPTNNYVTNLEWLTHQENMQHTADAGRLGKAFCIRGHERTKDNIYPKSNGCIACNRMKSTAYQGNPITRPGSTWTREYCPKGHRQVLTNIYISKSKDRANPVIKCKSCRHDMAVKRWQRGKRIMTKYFGGGE